MAAGNAPPSLVSAPDCAICKNMSVLVRTGENPSPSEIPETMFYPATRLGTVKDFAKSAEKCPVCQALLGKLAARSDNGETRQFADHDIAEMAYIRFRAFWEIDIKQPRNPIDHTSGQDMAWLRAIRQLGPQDVEIAPILQEGEMTGFATDKRSVDFSRIKNWIQYCDTHHQGSCFKIEDPWKRMDAPEGLYFVDVEEECVTPQTESTTPYLTLSYVWGDHSSPLMSTMANLDAMHAPRSLAESSPLGKRLPQTIRDAIAVTRNLGFRYLWVDRLCIVQDCDKHRPAQLAIMAAIYGNSSLTIIADNGDDSRGLSGVASGAPERHGFNVVSLPGEIRLILDETTDSWPQDPIPPERTYRFRGWTLQEELLSNRTLKFNRREVRWMCRKSRFREVLDDKPQMFDNRKSSLEIQLFKPNPDVGTYSHLAEDFTGRFLTYDGDAVHAFSAIVSAYSKSMAGGILYGLPEFLFEGAMLWQSWQPIQRRDTSAATPSWSFLGWRGGGLDLKMWGSLYTNEGRNKHRQDVFFSSPIKILPCVEYHKFDSQSGNKVMIKSSYHGTTDEGLDLFETRHCHRVPIPQEPYPSTQSSSWSPILSIRTQLCRIQAGDTFPQDANDPRQGRCQEVFLVDDNAVVIGVLVLNSTVNTISGTKVPLIVISRGITVERSTRWGLREIDIFHADCEPFHCYPKSDRCRAGERFVPYDFYNVLWVSWVDGIAYREGIGRVLRSAWEALGPEEVEIKLG